MGDELTLGQSLDTNARWLAQRLVERGILPVEHVTVPDELEAIVGVIERAARVSDVIVSTGGLGPTADDLTREAVARASGDSLVEDPGSIEQIKAWFASRGRAMSPLNAVQAMRPSRARAIANAWGTAPGIHAVIPCGGDGRAVDGFFLPGPPQEMKPMFDADVLPRLELEAGRVVITRAIHTIGLGESEVAARLGPLMARDREVLVGTTASMGVVSIRIRFEGHDGSGDGTRRVREVEDQAKGLVAGHVVWEGEEGLAEVLIRELRARKERVAVVESCTGGMLGEMLTDVSGSSDTFVGGWITYSNEMKQSEVGVGGATLAEHGAVSRETAIQMATGGMARSGSDLCCAVTGIAGPGGGSDQKPVGTVYVCVARRGSEPDCRHLRMSGSRDAVRRWAASSAIVLMIFAARGLRAPALLREVAPLRS